MCYMTGIANARSFIMKKTFALAFVLALSPLAACGDDDGGSNNNHLVWYDAATQHDAAAQTDAAVQSDARPQQDAAGQHDAAPGADAATANGVVGDPCATVGECGGIGGGLPAECLTSLMGMVTLPGGYCTATCTAGDPDPCAGSGGVCVNAMIASYCLKPCATVAECREAEGYTCSAPPTGGEGTYCLPPMGMP
jgi:hypothetical protein